MGITVLPTAWIYQHMCRFLRFFPTFVYEKTETKLDYVLYEGA